MRTKYNISARLRIRFDAELRVIFIWDIELNGLIELPQKDNQQYAAVEAIFDPLLQSGPF